MPVVVTAAESPLGRLVVARLRADGAEVRAVVAKPTSDLGVPTAVVEWADAERLGAVLEGAHTVIHLAGRRHVAELLAAAEDSGVVRIVTTVRHPALDEAAYETVFVEAPKGMLGRGVRDAETVAAALVEADRRA